MIKTTFNEKQIKQIKNNELTKNNSVTIKSDNDLASGHKLDQSHQDRAGPAQEK
ncbi:hypothetical protein [Shewanella saliphila]|uniref:Uncharacterized protein n=1 Tax=Shewanella saliphila TaxID=2282698 RepID=A0ABQ2Q1H1_9GAMM|nr:hypothetical protein [Shewanella saliphila]MCL1100577.1 hypothetical protein [Shewanella saliphila]GGP41180.1 hypothetical protein GCM10009409_05080 [Shewanella saliphila]